MSLGAPVVGFGIGLSSDGEVPAIFAGVGVAVGGVVVGAIVSLLGYWARAWIQERE